jgi:hypothetical protein
MPNNRPAVMETIRNARKGFSLAQLTSITSRIMQKRMVSNAIYLSLIGLAVKERFLTVIPKKQNKNFISLSFVEKRILLIIWRSISG